MTSRPIAFVHVDMDGLWAVRACYGRPEADTFDHDPVWRQGARGLLRLFDWMNIPASFFIVGRDMEDPAKRRVARAVHAAGHEIGNHSYSHRIGLTRLPMGAIREELWRAHDALLNAGLPGPVGFRAPGYDVDARVFRAVRQAGYTYDSSMLPTRLSPALRVADAWLARRWQPGKRQFGRIAYGSAPREAYHPAAGRIREAGLPDTCREVPVTTLGFWGLPLTGSAIFAFGPRRIIAMLEHHALRHGTIMLLLHGIDLTDCDRPIVFDSRCPNAGGFSMTARQKRSLLAPVLRWLSREFRVERTRDWIERG